MIEYLRWQVRIWRIRFGERAHERLRRFEMKSYWHGETASFDRFVDRLSPFDSTTGYHRIRVRRLLYRLRYPFWFTKRGWYALVNHLFYEPWFGRYGGLSDPADSLKVQWLNEHSEYADAETGDTETYIHASLFRDLDVPWSRQPETWLLTTDDRGFVDGERGEEAAIRFLAIDAEYGDFNVEGQPEFNGAFR